MNSFKDSTHLYQKPFNFDASNRFFSIFKDCTEFSAEPKIELINNVRVTNSSVVFKGSKVLRETCIGEEIYRKYQDNFWRFRFKFIFPQLNFSKKRFILLSDEWTSNYYHWHVFALGKLVILQDAGLIEDSLILLPEKYKNYTMVRRSLAKFGIRENQLVFLRKKSNIKVAELPLVSVTQHHPEVMRKVYEKVQGGAKNSGDKIYISREKSRSRFVENEKEVVAMLESYGFKKILAESLSYEQQEQIMSKAKYLVSSHGAGLTNMLFMEKGSYVLELANISKAVKPVTDYYKMADIIGINYLYQECEMGESTKHLTSDPHEGSVYVDLAWLEQNLKLMLQQ